MKEYLRVLLVHISTTNDYLLIITTLEICLFLTNRNFPFCAVITAQLSINLSMYRWMLCPRLTKSNGVWKDQMGFRVLIGDAPLMAKCLLYHIAPRLSWQQRKLVIFCIAECYFAILVVLVLPHSTLLICGFSAFSTMSPATIHKYLKMFAIVPIFYNSLIAIFGITNITKSSLGVSVIYHCYLV